LTCAFSTAQDSTRFPCLPSDLADTHVQEGGEQERPGKPQICFIWTYRSVYWSRCHLPGLGTGAHAGTTAWHPASRQGYHPMKGCWGWTSSALGYTGLFFSSPQI